MKLHITYAPRDEVWQLQIIPTTDDNQPLTEECGIVAMAYDQREIHTAEIHLKELNGD